MSPKKAVAIILLPLVQLISSTSIQREWSLSPIKTISIVPIALSSNDRTIAELYPNETSNGRDSSGLLANLTSYGIDGRLQASCHVSLLGPKEYLASRKIGLSSIGDGKEVVRWYIGSLRTNEVWMGVMVVDKESCEVVAKTRLLFEGNPDNGHPDFSNFQNVEVLATAGGFELVIPAEFLCKADLCRVKYGQMSRQFHKVESFVDDVALGEEQWKMLQITQDPNSKNHFVALRSEDSMKVISKSKQTILQLSKPKLEAYSTFNELFSRCALFEDNRVECLQLDSNLITKLNVTIQLRHTPKTIAVHSSPNVGLLLITTNDGVAKVARIDEASNYEQLLRIKLGCEETRDFAVYQEENKTCVQYFCRASGGMQGGVFNEEFFHVMRGACF